MSHWAARAYRTRTLEHAQSSADAPVTRDQKLKRKVAAPAGTATFTVLLQATNCLAPGSGVPGYMGS